MSQINNEIDLLNQRRFSDGDADYIRIITGSSFLLLRKSDTGKGIKPISYFS